MPLGMCWNCGKLAELLEIALTTDPPFDRRIVNWLIEAWRFRWWTVDGPLQKSPGGICKSDFCGVEALCPPIKSPVLPFGQEPEKPHRRSTCPHGIIMIRPVPEPT